ncbi:DUF4157 domain-containing protein [Nostoc sp. UHCC 0926]|uniref:eCIS core domain-containing protein n=1 Tax=unclassified Nostoc TaxID=2593658 RepID=UPI0023614FE7|nr:DUF4157 domain-containing protein [Nostoc sp. UHCC 0926]WDD32563.1 DUF4157 domain-containing protein [Nostoc sp. UHCC 0926]
MREHVSQSKKATTASFSIPSLKHRIPGFGLDSSQASPQAVPLVQPLHKPLTHDISRIPLRNPQAKLSISQPGDKYEQEADSVAQQVMQRIAQPVNRQSIQREALPEEEQLQMKPMANSITPLVQRQEMLEDEEELQMKSLDNSTLQRQEMPEDEEELQMKPMVQRRAEASMAAAPDLEASINQARGGGQAMAKNIRHPMEVAFGTDFSGVKVHTDGQSDQLNRSIQARAFTTGQDVFFRQGEYNPGSRGGQELLAHELTHVVQQNGGAVQRSQLKQPSSASMFIVQRVISNTQQTNTNRCWAAVGYAIHKHFGGQEPTEASFVTNFGSASARAKYLNNEVCDIDDIIGSSSAQNHLTGHDGVGEYGKSGLTAKFNKNEPIVANVGGVHYIILTGGHSEPNKEYAITYMDPDTGTTLQDQQCTLNRAKTKVTGVGTYKLTNLYYTG